jgi:hypothetical protein
MNVRDLPGRAAHAAARPSRAIGKGPAAALLAGAAARSLEPIEAPNMLPNSPMHLIPTTFRYQTADLCAPLLDHRASTPISHNVGVW